MLKTIVTLVRGRVFEAQERLVDQSALTLLDQQMRDSAVAVARAKKALARAFAQDQAEGRKLSAARAEIAALEGRAVEALRAGRADLAERAAETIAAHEAEALSEAEATLARLREKQVEACAAEAALDALDAETAPESLNDMLAAAGFGPPLKPRAADVLARLKEKAGAPA
ncbi:MAG: PspA/IM30 family protein [Methylocystis sp.]|uniref:PspA/IM30 family protein n=1 Tax=Methylocystis sp. TaxID=1911079 RepID=UPI003DA2B651